MRFLMAILLLGGVAVAQAAEWVPVSQISSNVREVDKGSIRGAKPMLNFTSRHVIDDGKELSLGRNPVKYLVMEQRADCARRTILTLTSEAQRTDGSTISKQRLLAQEAVGVLEGSVDEDILKFVCSS